MSAAPAPPLQEGPPMSASDILDNARALADRVREKDLAIEYDRLRQLPVDIAEEVRASGVMRMNMPKHWGGPEMNPMEQVEVIAALCAADASIGWCSFIWTDSGIYSGYLDDAVGREMYPRLDMATSGWIYPVGQARLEDGAYHVEQGHWIFGSGSNHCDWLAAGCTVFEGDAPKIDPRTGLPEWRVLLAPRDDYEIQDTWYTTGLRGTGSNDYTATNLIVPAERTFTFFDEGKREGSIWKRPDHLLRKMAGVPLGVMEDAIRTAIEMLEGKTDKLTHTPYRDIPRVREAIAEARIRYARARSYVFSSLEKQWDLLENDEPLTTEVRADTLLSRVNAFQEGREVARLLYDTVGGSAIYSQKSPFDRHLRDMQTACQHVVAQRKTLENGGSMLLGNPMAHPLV
ncbi:MAG: acyl-CoA dehydrogenase family protein [Myxococcota bacterium]